MTGERPFRFFDNREKYPLFVTTCSEKWAIGQRIGAELSALEPQPPALRVFDAGRDHVSRHRQRKSAWRM